MIFKAQRPLSHPKTEWLVYSRGKPKLYFVKPELIPADVKAAIGDEPKVYFEGSVDNGVITIDAIVAEQDW